jgi:hypothetical protein
MLERLQSKALHVFLLRLYAITVPEFRSLFIKNGGRNGAFVKKALFKGGF